MSTIQNIISKLAELGGQTNCNVVCHYTQDGFVDGDVMYPPEFIEFTATTARIHTGSITCIDFRGSDINGSTYFISSNNLDNTEDAHKQLWEQIKKRA